MKIFNQRANSYFVLGYFVMSFIQLFAIADGIKESMGFPGMIATIVAFFISYVPVAGPLLAFFSAVSVWDWQPWVAGLVYLWYIPAAMIFAILGWTANNHSQN